MRGIAGSVAAAALMASTAIAQGAPEAPGTTGKHQHDECDRESMQHVRAFSFGMPGEWAYGDRSVLGIGTSSGGARDTLGVLVTQITPNGPADKAGLEEGDRIIAANGVDLRLSPSDAGEHEMRGLMSRRLARTVQKTKAGDVVELKIYANGQTKTVKVTTVKAADLFKDHLPRFGALDTQTDAGEQNVDNLMFRTWDAPEPLVLPEVIPEPPLPPPPPPPAPNSGRLEHRLRIQAPVVPATAVPTEVVEL